MKDCSKYLKTRFPPDLGPRLDGVFGRALAGCVFSGAALLVASEAGPIFSKTWGRTRKGGDPVDSSTRFDLASLTKALVTAPLALTAVARGMLGLEDRLDRFFPAGSVPPQKRDITVRDLLGHVSGLPPLRPFHLGLVGLPPGQRRSALVSMILETPLDAVPGSCEIYSDLGYLLLGIILEKLFGDRLDGVAENILFAPQGISGLHFCPLKTGCDPESIPQREPIFSKNETERRIFFAATQVCPWRRRLLSGEVDDENCWCLDGVAGHAGLFGTAEGVFALVSFLWDLYEGGRTEPFWPRELVRLFWTEKGSPRSGSRRLGFDTPSPADSSAGRYFSRSSVGHLGFTGTSFWLDPERRILIVLLTNRVHPTRQNEAIRQFRPLVHDTIMEALI